MSNSPPTTTDGDKSGEVTREISPEVLTITAKFSGLPQEEIAKSYAGKFKPVNLYKLLHLKGIEDMSREDRVAFDGNVLKIKKAVGTMKDDGNTPAVWFVSTLNNSQHMVSFSGGTTSDLFFALAKLIARFWTWLKWTNGSRLCSTDY